MPSFTSFSTSQVHHNDAIPVQFTVPNGVTLVGGDFYVTPEGEVIIVYDDYEENVLAAGIRRCERFSGKVDQTITVAVGDTLYLNTGTFLATNVDTGTVLGRALEATTPAAKERILMRIDPSIN